MRQGYRRKSGSKRRAAVSVLKHESGAGARRGAQKLNDAGVAPIGRNHKRRFTIVVLRVDLSACGVRR